MPEYRAVFDAEITFSNEGGLQAQRFRVDIPDPNVSHEEIARLFVTSLDLLMTEAAVVSNVQIIEEPTRALAAGLAIPVNAAIDQPRNTAAPGERREGQHPDARVLPRYTTVSTTACAASFLGGT